MSEARIDSLSNESNTGGPTLSGITTFSSTNYFVPPVGNTAQRPENPQKGAIRFNTDTKHLEYFRGNAIGWTEIEASSEELDGGHRGLIMGGGNPGQVATIDYHNLASAGTWASFGSLFSGRYGCSGTSSRTRGVLFGGYGSNNDTVDYVTMSSEGDSIDALNLSVDHKYGAAWSNGTRACIAGSYYPAQINTIDYVDIATLGYAKDFGDLTVKRGIMKAANSTTRGIIGGGYTDSNSPTLTIDYVNTSSRGDALDFGDLVPSTGQSGSAVCNATRAIWGGSYSNTLGSIQMATTGNMIDFADNSSTHGHRPSCSSPIRGMWCGGRGASSPYPATTDVDSVLIASAGSATSFGSISQARFGGGECDNGHGGL